MAVSNELLLAKNYIKNSGLYLVSEEQFDELAEIAVDAYSEYPLHLWLSNGKYDKSISRIIMKITLKSMKDNALIYADSNKLKGFAVWMPPGFTGNKVIPFLKNGGLKLLRHNITLIKKLLSYENYAMNLKKTYTKHNDWYLYNIILQS